MMGQGFGSAIEESIILGLVVLVVIAFILGGLVTWLLPKLWLFIKPIIHTITA